jgi:hypothetical protein
MGVCRNLNETTKGTKMGQIQPNQEPPEDEYNLEISLTIKEMQDLVDYVNDNTVNIKYIIENLIDQMNPEVYGIKSNHL